jgi:16S rRNA (cytidine1402-2'-O)-methyltransferase
MNKADDKGKLYVIGTPIGNLKDITLRAIETLKSVTMILAEDTRKSAILLKQYGVETKMLSYRDQNHDRIFPQILQLLITGSNVALISDSGTPTISDPGFKLVSALRRQDVEIVSIPGPSAVIAALSISGLPTDKFIFLGFLPKGESKRRKMLEKYGSLEATIVLYESPFRLKKLLMQIQKALGERTVCIANELTKKFEKVRVGTPKELLSSFTDTPVKGEYVVLISK